MSKQTTGQMLIHNDPVEMQSGHYWCLDMEHNRTSIVYWNKEKKYFSIFGDKRKFFASHFAKGVLFIGELWLDPTCIEDAVELYDKLLAVKPKEATIIILPTAKNFKKDSD